MKKHFAVVAVLGWLAVVGLVSGAGAEVVVEAWRSPAVKFAGVRSVALNTTDGSYWLAEGEARVMVHLATDGTELWRSASGEFDYVYSISVNPSDGSCWVAELGPWNGSAYLSGVVVHLSASGAELWRSASGEFIDPGFVSVNPTDGSCWVADPRQWDGSAYTNSSIVHLSASGAELWRSGPRSSSSPVSVSVNPSDGSCWVADMENEQVVHLSAAGTQLWRSAERQLQQSHFRLGEPDGRLLLGGGLPPRPGGAPVRGRDGAVAVGQRRVR